MSKKKKGPGAPKKPKGEKFVYIGFRTHPKNVKKHGGKAKARAVAKEAVEK